MSETDVATADATHADIGLVCALPLELSEFLSRCRRVNHYSGGNFTFRGGLYDNIRIAVVESGPGPVRAARATQALLDAHSPKWIVSTGFAGALVSEMHVGHIVVADHVTRTDGSSLAIDVGMKSDLSKGIHVGRMLTVDHMIRTVSEKKDLARQTGAIAVEMESFAVATVCRKTGTRFMAVRAISDDSSADLPPEVLSLVGETGAVRFGAVVGSLFKRPSSLKDMWRLREHATIAAKTLADFLDGIIIQLHRASTKSG